MRRSSTLCALAVALVLAWPSRAFAADIDMDGIDDSIDNCIGLSNPGQENNDLDPQGDACDGDDDNDGKPDPMDNCPFHANPGQFDSDGDTKGEPCDNCPSIANPQQEDADGDKRGDVCDNCIFIGNPGQTDSNGNNIGDACDLGAPCVNAGTCVSGFCVGGLCCASSCDGVCESCMAADTGVADGTCGPRPAAHVIKAECVGDNAVTSVCDGKGDVGPFEVQSCGLYACASGVCGASCDMLGGCSAGAFCDVDFGACEEKRPDGLFCDVDGQCSSNLCLNGACSAGATPGCEADGHTLRAADGSTSDCSPYACKNDACLLTCGSIRECAAPFICDPSGFCVALPPIDAGELSCALPPLGGAAGSGLVGIGLCAVAAGVVVRRARSRGRKAKRFSYR